MNVNLDDHAAVWVLVQNYLDQAPIEKRIALFDLIKNDVGNTPNVILPQTLLDMEKMEILKRLYERHSLIELQAIETLSKQTFKP